jgi:hypothetical protein
MTAAPDTPSPDVSARLVALTAMVSDLVKVVQAATSVRPARSLTKEQIDEIRAKVIGQPLADGGIVSNPAACLLGNDIPEQTIPLTDLERFIERSPDDLGEAIQAGAAVGEALAPAAAPYVARLRSRHRLASRKLWVAVSTIGGLLSQNAIGLHLHPAAQLAIAILAAVYVVVQAEIDKREPANGKAQEE